MEMHLAIRKAYFNALTGNITAPSGIVPIYDAYAIPEQAQYPYILISAQSSVQTNVKRYKNYTANVQVDVVTGSLDPIGREDSEVIAGQIEDIIIPATFADLDVTPYGYTIHDTVRENSFDDYNKRTNYYIYRKILSYSHLISKN